MPVNMVRSIQWSCYIYTIPTKNDVQFTGIVTFLLNFTAAKNVDIDDMVLGPNSDCQSLGYHVPIYHDPPAQSQMPTCTRVSPADEDAPAPTVAPAPTSSPPPTPMLQTINSCLVADDEQGDEDIEFLGEDPSIVTLFGKDIHSGVATRIEHIITNGLENESKKEITKKYLIPENCQRLIPPILNSEIKAALTETNLKRDKGLENRQKQISTCINCLSQIVTDQMEKKNRDSDLIKNLMNTIRMLCDTMHADTQKRKYFALSSLKKEVNEQLGLTKPDKYLFGENVAETIRTAKTVTKSVADIRATTYNNKKPAQSAQPQPSSSRLNWKAPFPTRRQPGPQRSRQPYPPAAQGPRSWAPPPPQTRAPPPPPPPAASSRSSRYPQSRQAPRRY